MSYKEDFETIFINEKECHRMMLPYRTAIKTVKTKLESLDDEMKCAFEGLRIVINYSAIPRRPNSPFK